ncbi:type VI secretion system-associated FHA domain protein TagH [Undibacterium sp. Di27W]|uniref:type VI secretion system-associated FHA domain protein TagH n=1 Tax=Undibacterium sp. Di27W TaxID=3413036 RepID=UPI003BF07F04
MIKIAVVSYNNEVPETPISAVFGPEPATIGRNVENFLALPDPKHFVSRTQAHAWSKDGKHFINNLSLANPVSINGKEIKAETAFEIHPGDQIQIGLYLLTAEAAGLAEAAAATDIAADENEHAQQDLTTDTAAPATIAQAAEVEAEGEPAAQVAQDSNTGIVTENVTDSVITGQPVVPPVAKDSVAAQPPQFLLRPEAIQATAEVNTEVSSKPVVATAEAAADVPASAAKADVVKPASHASHASHNAQELMHAFLQGAGLQQLNLASGLTVELMETLGKFMAASVQGAMEELSQRALLKREVKAEVTMVVLRENNPLKFFPDSKTVLTQMLRKKMPGFMAPSEAMEDAFFDIRAHQMGVTAGNRAVTDAILKTLQPGNVEAQLGTPGLLDQINPGRRKAAMWDQFSELFDTISAGKKDEFQAMFGKEFLLAYEKEVEKAESNR